MASSAFAAKLAALGAHPDQMKIREMRKIAESVQYDQIEVRAILDVIMNALRNVRDTARMTASFSANTCSQAPSNAKLAVLYTLDAILKLVGGSFVKYSEDRIVRVISSILPHVSGRFELGEILRSIERHLAGRPSNRGKDSAHSKDMATIFSVPSCYFGRNCACRQCEQCSTSSEPTSCWRLRCPRLCAPAKPAEHRAASRTAAASQPTF